MHNQSINPKDLNQTDDAMITKDGKKIQKGMMMAIVVNIQRYEDPSIDPNTKHEIKETLTQQLSAIAPSGIFKYFTCQSKEVQQIIDQITKSTQ